MVSSFAHVFSGRGDALIAKLAANLPMMSKRVNNTPDAPAMHLAYRNHHSRAGAYCAFEDSVRIGNRQDHPNSTTAKRLRTEIVMLRRFIAQPKLRAVDRKPGYHGPVRGINAEGFNRSKRGLIELNGFRALPD
jgi:hypothetical protein